jgi:hypothetical protein
MTNIWTDRNSSELELTAALTFWRANHTPGARRRVREAIAYYRRYH